MRPRKSILSITAALALTALPVLALPPKSADKKMVATVVSMTDDTLVVRVPKGNKDEVFKIDSSTHKASGISAGNKITVNYRKDGGRLVATDIELSGTN
jgi:hypothetical protein